MEWSNIWIYYRCFQPIIRPFSYLSLHIQFFVYSFIHWLANSWKYSLFAFVQSIKNLSIHTLIFLRIHGPSFYSTPIYYLIQYFNNFYIYTFILPCLPFIYSFVSSVEYPNKCSFTVQTLIRRSIHWYVCSTMYLLIHIFIHSCTDSVIRFDSHIRSYVNTFLH